jgi:hypothetical protein
MVDTCAGLDIGHLPHHLSIYETSSCLDNFIYLIVVDYLKKSDVGGVNEHGNRTKIIAIILQVPIPHLRSRRSCVLLPS